MKSYSFGIIPLFRHPQSWEVLLVQSRDGGHWSFPKGRREEGEVPEQTALRELKEETGIKDCVLLPLKEILEESYSFVRGDLSIEKTVRYFLAEVFSKKVDIQEEEILDFQWADILRVPDLLTFPEAKKICQQAIQILEDYDDNIRS